MLSHSKNYEILLSVLIKLHEKEMKLTKNKCVFIATQVAYFGYILAGKKVHVNNARANFPTPTNKRKVLHKLIGVSAYLGIGMIIHGHVHCGCHLSRAKQEV